jgi:hypothetical protein
MDAGALSEIEAEYVPAAPATKHSIASLVFDPFGGIV